MGQWWSRLWCCWRPRAPEDDPFATEPIDDPNHGIPMLDRSLAELVSKDGTGSLVFSTPMSEGRAVYSVDLQPPFALRSINGNLIAALERVRTLETPHKLVLHGKGDEYSPVNARDFSRYYQITISSSPMLTEGAKCKGLRHIGVLSSGVRSGFSPITILLHPPGEYPSGTGMAEQLRLISR